MAIAQWLHNTVDAGTHAWLATPRIMHNMKHSCMQQEYTNRTFELLRRHFEVMACHAVLARSAQQYDPFGKKALRRRWSYGSLWVLQEAAGSP